MAIFTFNSNIGVFFRRNLQEFSIWQTLVIKGSVHAVVSSMIFSFITIRSKTRGSGAFV